MTTRYIQRDVQLSQNNFFIYSFQFPLVSSQGNTQPWVRKLNYNNNQFQIRSVPFLSQNITLWQEKIMSTLSLGSKKLIINNLVNAAGMPTCQHRADLGSKKLIIYLKRTLWRLQATQLHSRPTPQRTQHQPRNFDEKFVFNFNDFNSMLTNEGDCEHFTSFHRSPGLLLEILMMAGPPESPWRDNL